MNERDSEAIACMLEAHGFLPAETEQDADILIFNTCSVRDQAERKAEGKIGLLRKRKRERPDLVIGVVGCMAQNHGAALTSRLEHVDFVLGTDRLDRLPEAVSDALGARERTVDTGVEARRHNVVGGHHAGQHSAYVAVMRGCNQFCTYCIVPYVRGREKSRSIAEVVDEVETLTRNGTVEIFLLGQNITAYGFAEARREKSDVSGISPFADLLEAVHEVPGVRRIRFTSPHPKYMNERFVEAVTTLPKVCNAFHIPLQSGSDRILDRMRRGYNVQSYLACIEAIRNRAPDAVFSTDVIVGFPGETANDFEATRSVMAEVGFDMAYIFKYSPRSGTRASEWEDDVPKDIKESRNRIVLADLEDYVEKANQRYRGRDVEVLVEGVSKRNADRWAGKTRSGKHCFFTPVAGLTPGQFVQVRVDRATSHSLYGAVVGRDLKKADGF